MDTGGRPARRARSPRSPPLNVVDDELVAAVHALHGEIRAAVSRCQAAAARAGRWELASQPLHWGAGDRTYALDAVADEPLRRFVERVGARRPITLIAEGPGELSAAPRSGGGAPIRVLVDPIDGTRPLMLDLRPAWIVTGVAPDCGPGTRLSDVELAVQTELPLRSAAVSLVLEARRGQGATICRHDVSSGARLDRQWLLAREDTPLDNGVFSFTRYLPEERPLVAALEQRVLGRLLAEHGLDPHLMYDDQYLCTAGALHLLATGRYRMLADLRGWLGTRHGLDNLTVKPYDVAGLLIFREAGVPVLDARGSDLDAPFDTSTRLDVVAFGNQRLRAAFEPALREALKG